MAATFRLPIRMAELKGPPDGQLVSSAHPLSTRMGRFRRAHRMAATFRLTEV